MNVLKKLALILHYVLILHYITFD